MRTHKHIMLHAVSIDTDGFITGERLIATWYCEPYPKRSEKVRIAIEYNDDTGGDYVFRQSCKVFDVGDTL